MSCGKSDYTFNNVTYVEYKRVYEATFLPTATLEYWLIQNNITAEHLELYPNAVKAKKLKDSKLYKAMK